ncbi:sulfate ABC transporter substrate-binding protein [Streptomyces cinnamoneus]|uniref:Sulfate ABC transporter substrate-binding protein n=1 Tax=Streptomyces cinnamoneus TaxID=53446 RepID=A0A2G1XEM2_STRCJ|nr:aliphatic sulfonate ABC transporter substrate-binding protein [Streptomyces cinnamoneus]PHQ49673.1 sulfate ABC transporter substrate-binding protein [Streptomyces cinnamoneus]PPT14604.1 aliphatic sulfonate ABC transporter substrate-binding protein [Streptomyces cinnamoneus]
MRPLPSVRRALAAVAVAVLALTLGGCGYGSQRDERSQVAPKGERLSAGTVRIGYFPTLTHATPLVGLREGILQKELGGTRLKAVGFNAGPSAVEALNAGSVDISWIGPSPAVNGYQRAHGENLRIISGAASGGVKFVVDPKKITSPEDVRGKRIATPQKGNTQDVALLHWITGRGWAVDPRTGKGDVSVVRTDAKAVPGAFASGSVDGAWVPEPTASRLVAAGGKVLLDESGLWPDGKFVTANVVVSRKFLDRHPDVVEAVLRGSVRTNAWIAAHPDRSKVAANAALKDLSGSALPADVLDPAWQSVRTTDDPLAATLSAQAEHAVAAGLLKKPDLTGIYDLTLLGKVLRSEGKPPVDAGGPGSR